MSNDIVLGLIAGTGAELPTQFEVRTTHSIETPFGNAARCVEGVLNGCELRFIMRHGVEHSVAPHRINYRANLWGLRSVGVTHVLALNTVGGIHQDAQAGTLWLPDNLIDYTWGREQSFYDGTTLELRHQEFAEPYSAAMRSVVLAAASRAGLAVRDGGVYGCTQGPRLETAAEIRRMQRDGCDLVGMTGMPEAALAAELELEYAALALVVNPAAGLSPEPISLDEIMREAASCMAQVQRLLPELAKELSSQ